MRYYWYYRPDRDFPPPPTQEPSLVGPSSRLRIGLSENGKVVDAWCAILPTLTQVDTLWISAGVSQRLFEAVCRMSWLQGLWIKHSRVSTLESLLQIGKLRQFHLGSSPSLASIEPLAACRQLEWLGLVNFKKIASLEPLSGLTGLVGLCIEGSMWTTQHVHTLGPLGNLRQPRFLSMLNLRSADRTLAPLFVLRNLESLGLAQWWSSTEIAELRRLNPGLREAVV